MSLSSRDWGGGGEENGIERCKIVALLPYLVFLGLIRYDLSRFEWIRYDFFSPSLSHTHDGRFFVEALLGLAEQLGALSPKKRAKGLQEGLEGINEFFLSERAQGSDVIYVPFGEDFHQARRWLA